MSPMIHSDWHIHSEYSYDAKTPLSVIAENAAAQGLRRFGITDHLNFNDTQFLGDINASSTNVLEFRKTCPEMVLGVELTPIEKPRLEYIAKTGTREGYIPPEQDGPYAIELAATKEYLMSLGIRYAIGAAHWRVDVPYATKLPPDRDACIREWYRQQLYLASDERVTILGHPWYIGKALWYEDFSVIPASMNDDIASELKAHHKYVECNAHFFRTPNATDTFKRQYGEFLRDLFERGIPLTYGSDAHGGYPDKRESIEPFLRAAGFSDGDITEVREEDLW